jgi:excisionase family DNA binding protein
MNQPSTYMSVRTIIQETDVTERTVRRWISDGELPTVRFGPRCVRVPRDAYERFVQTREVSRVAP